MAGDLSTSGQIGRRNGYFIYYDANGGRRKAVSLGASGDTSGVTEGAIRISSGSFQVGASNGEWLGRQGIDTGGGGTNGSIYVDYNRFKYVDSNGTERYFDGDLDYMATDISSALSLTDRYDGIRVTLDYSQVQDHGQHLIGRLDTYRKTTDDGTVDGYTRINKDSPSDWVDTNVTEGYEYTYKMTFVLNGTRDTYTTPSNEPSITWTNPDGPVSGTPSGLSLGTGSTCALEGTWSTNDGYKVECNLQESSDGSTNWSTVTNSSGNPVYFQEPEGALSADFQFSDGTCYSPTSGYYYRFRARYYNNNEVGDWSSYSDTHYYSGDFETGG